MARRVAYRSSARRVAYIFSAPRACARHVRTRTEGKRTRSNAQARRRSHTDTFRTNELRQYTIITASRFHDANGPRTRTLLIISLPWMRTCRARYVINLPLIQRMRVAITATAARYIRTLLKLEDRARIPTQGASQALRSHAEDFDWDKDQTRPGVFQYAEAHGKTMVQRVKKQLLRFKRAGVYADCGAML